MEVAAAARCQAPGAACRGQPKGRAPGALCFIRALAWAPPRTGVGRETHPYDGARGKNQLCACGADTPPAPKACCALPVPPPKAGAGSVSSQPDGANGDPTCRTIFPEAAMATRTLEYLVSVVEGEIDDPLPTARERELAVELIRLERDERQLSAIRRKLHERLASFPNEMTEWREFELSLHRRHLHTRIDLLEAELAILGWERSSRRAARARER